MRSGLCDELLPVLAVRIERRGEYENRGLGGDGDKVRVAGVGAVAELDVGDCALHLGVCDDLDGLEGVVVVKIYAPSSSPKGNHALVGVYAREPTFSGNGLNLLLEV